MIKTLDLKYALENGIINQPHIEGEIELSKRKEYLNNHKYSVWEKNGYWYTTLPNATKGRVQYRRKQKEDLENLIVDFYKAQDESPFVGDLFNEWNDRRLELRQISKATYYRHKYDYNRYFENLANQRIGEVTASGWAEFLEEQVAKYNLTSKAYNNLKTLVRGVIGRARRRKCIEYSFEEVKIEMVDNLAFKKTFKKDSEEVYDEIETEKMMRYLKENQNLRNLAILLLFVTGMRIGEVVSLKNEDVESNNVFVCRTETSYKENHKLIFEVKDFPKTENSVRHIIVPKDYEWLLKKIKRLNPFGDYIFVENGERLTTKRLSGTLKRVCEKAGVPYKSAHKIRKTYVSILLDSGIDKRMVLDQVGHSCIEVSENYYHRNRKTIDRKQEILSAIGEFSG